MKKYVTREKRVSFPAGFICLLVPSSSQSYSTSDHVIKNCFHHSKIIFISWCHRVISSVY